MLFDQSEFDIRCEWGRRGVAALAPISDAIVIVDIMSFSTCIAVAVSRGATVFPYRFRDETASEYARSVNAELAGPRGSGGYNLSPTSLMSVTPGARIVLPSPNGSTLTLSTGQTPTFAGCLRNSKAVARAAMVCGPRIAVIPAGERWREDDSLRPSFEDLVGAGAIIRHLPGTRSPEARLAELAFLSVADSLPQHFRACSSGKELAERAGFEEDLVLFAELDVDDCAPVLRDGAYRRNR